MKNNVYLQICYENYMKQYFQVLRPYSDLDADD